MPVPVPVPVAVQLPGGPSTQQERCFGNVRMAGIAGPVKARKPQDPWNHVKGKKIETQRKANAKQRDPEQRWGPCRSKYRVPWLFVSLGCSVWLLIALELHLSQSTSPDNSLLHLVSSRFHKFHPPRRPWLIGPQGDERAVVCGLRFEQVDLMPCFKHWRGEWWRDTGRGQREGGRGERGAGTRGSGGNVRVLVFFLALTPCSSLLAPRSSLAPGLTGLPSAAHRSCLALALAASGRIRRNNRCVWIWTWMWIWDVTVSARPPVGTCVPPAIPRRRREPHHPRPRRHNPMQPPVGWPSPQCISPVLIPRIPGVFERTERWWSCAILPSCTLSL